VKHCFDGPNAPTWAPSGPCCQGEYEGGECTPDCGCADSLLDYAVQVLFLAMIAGWTIWICLNSSGLPWQ
jgi:hypothetical protein